MNYCEKCNVYVDESLERCPLCKKTLAEHPKENENYPNVHKRHYVDSRNLIMDYFILSTLVVIGFCVAMNFLFWEGTPWFLAVAAFVLYMWILVRFTIVSQMFAGIKVLLQMLGIFVMCVAFDYVSYRTGWSISWALPLILTVGIAYMDVFSYQHKSYWRNNLMYSILFTALGFVPFVLYMSKVTDAFVPMLLALIASGLTILGIFRFAVRFIKLELTKRFHI